MSHAYRWTNWIAGGVTSISLVALAAKAIVWTSADTLAGYGVSLLTVAITLAAAAALGIGSLFLGLVASLVAIAMAEWLFADALDPTFLLAMPVLVVLSTIRRVGLTRRLRWSVLLLGFPVTALVADGVLDFDTLALQQIETVLVDLQAALSLGDSLLDGLIAAVGLAAVSIAGLMDAGLGVFYARINIVLRNIQLAGTKLISFGIVAVGCLVAFLHGNESVVAILAPTVLWRALWVVLCKRGMRPTLAFVLSSIPPTFLPAIPAGLYLGGLGMEPTTWAAIALIGVICVYVIAEGLPQMRLAIDNQGDKA